MVSLDIQGSGTPVRRRRTLCALLVVGQVGLLGTVARAQDAATVPSDAADSAQLSEVIVTARLQTESEQSVPISMTVVPGSDVASISTPTAADAGLARAAPNVVFVDSGGQDSNVFNIRGVGSFSPLSPDDTSVVLYTDNVPRSVYGAAPTLMDIDRVEVLRGPQGTLYGLNTQAAAGAKVGGLSLGAMLGGGVLVALFSRLGWAATFALMTGLILLATWPALGLARHDTPAGPRKRLAASLWGALKHPAMRRRLLRIVLVTCALMALFNFNRLMLIDSGVSLERIGWALGMGAPAVNLGASVIAPWLLRHYRPGLVFGTFVVAAVLSALLIITALTRSTPNIAIGASLLAGASVTGIYVVMASLILGWAAGSQAATDYALLYGVGRLVGTLALLGLPGIIALVGWRMFYGACAVAVVGAVSYFVAGLKVLSTETSEHGPVQLDRRASFPGEMR